ncbi:MAG TPA: glycosyltransferase family 2 protein, partial [Bryobacteraceae bacterium]|nr:glycosyltransferase family 2 protein [Bryobacteraceae bacterium]
VVLASRNTWDFVKACLSSIPRAGVEDYEIIVVDNASTDNTVARLKSEFPHVRTIVNPVNEGHCRAMNQGIAMASAEYVLVLDADTVLWPDSASRLIEFMRSRADVAIAAPRMLNPDGSIQETARTFPSVINGLFGRQSLLTRLFPDNRFSRAYMRHDKIDASQPFEVDWVSAAAMIFRRSLPDDIGLWDEDIKGYWVDADWCKTAHRAGKVYCVPSAGVTHFEQNRWGKKKGASRIILFHAGAYRFYRKHFTAGLLDPRAILAGVALGSRALLLLSLDSFRRADGKPDPIAVTSSPQLKEAATTGAQASRSAGAGKQ